MPKQKSQRPLLLMRFLSAAVCTVALLTIWMGVLGKSSRVEAATSSTINFQARLLTAAGNVVADGDYNVEFKLYTASAADGGETPVQGSCTTNPGSAVDEDCLWTETRIGASKVRVVNGYMTVNLGGVTVFPGTINWDQELWLGMNVGGSGSPSWDGEMTPRLKLTAVPYAFRAGQLATQSGSLTSTLSFAAPTSTSKTITIPNETGTICLQSSSSCGFLTPSAANAAYIQNTSSPQTANFNVTGNGTIGGVLSVTGSAVIQPASNSPTVFRVLGSGGDQVLVVDTSNNLVRVDAAGSITTASLTSGTGALQIGADNTYNLALDDNEIMVRNNGAADTLYVQKLGGGLNLQANTTIIKPNTDSASAFQVQQSSSAARVLGVDTSAASALFGQASSLNAKMVLYNSSNSNTVTIQSGTTSSSYTLTLPTVLGASGNCIKDITGTGVLGFGACGAGGGGGGSSLQDAYDNSGTANPQITLSATNGGLKIRDASGGVSGNLLQIQNSAGTATYFGLAATGLTLQDASGNNAFLFDSSTSHLRVYADTSSPTAYADIYYDNAAGEAVFTASTGTTRIGSGSGNISLQLTAAADVLQATKALTLGAAYSSNDFTFTRNITAAGNSLTGSVVKIESTSTGSGTVASNLLWINENNNSATGNLILATKNGAGNEKFKVDVNGAITAASGITTAAGITVASGQTVSSGSGALGVSAGSGNLTLTAGGANTVIAKPGTNSAASFQVQNASSVALFTADTSSNRLQVGSSTTDSTAILHVLDSYNQSTDPSGVNGAMYYSTSKNAFRCYENGAWKNCMNGTVDTLITTEQSSATFAKATAATIVITPLYIPGQMTVNEMRVAVTTALGAAGDIGIYNSSGTLVINGGSGSLTTGAAVKTIAPTQTGSARILEAGQYYLAVTWNSATGNIRGTATGSATVWPRNGTLATGGGSVLPSSVTLSSITAGTSVPFLGINN